MNLTEQTLEMIKGAQTRDLAKAFTVGTGLVNYDLEAPAKALYPVLTPLRNMIGRTKGRGDSATRWKGITGINTGNIGGGVEEGKRGAVLTQTVADFTAAYKGLGVEETVTFEAQYASEGFDDARARAVKGSLESLLVIEEKAIYGGNASLALGTPATPTGVAAGTGGTLTAQNWRCYVVALTPDGYARSTVAGGVATTASRTNADGSSSTVKYGSSQKSAESAAVASSGVQVVTWSVAAIQGAAAYAWYAGLTGAANCHLFAITTVNTVVMSTDPSGSTQAASAITADNSQDNLVFDGLWNFYGTAGNNGYYRTLGGATLTSDSAGGVVEIDTALQWFWDNRRLSPKRMIVAAPQALKISQIVASAGSSSIFNINVQSGAEGQRNLIAGTIVRSYLNKFFGGGVEVEIMLHPNAIPGTIMFDTETLPYQNTNIPAVRQMKTRQEYYQTEWPLRTRSYEFGVYVDELLQHYAPFSGGLLQNIG